MVYTAHEKEAVALKFSAGNLFLKKNYLWQCNTKRVPYEKSATRRKCNMKRIQYEKSATWREYNTGKVYIGNSKTWKECNTEKVQHDESIVIEWSFEKIFTRRVHKNAQTDNGSSVNVPLYTDNFKYSFFNTLNCAKYTRLVLKTSSPVSLLPSFRFEKPSLLTNIQHSIAINNYFFLELTAYLTR